MKAQIETTSKCNLTCQHCFRNLMSRPEQTIGPGTLTRALELCKVMGVESIALHGWGEPGMSGGILFHAIEEGTRKGFRMEFTNNGTFATRDWIDRLIEAKPWRVQFSLDVFHQGDPAAIKARDNVLEAVPRLQAAGIECAVRTVVSNKTDGRLDGIPEEWLVLPQRFMIFNADRPQRTKVCPIPGTTLMIWANGDVAPCCSDFDAVLVRANVDRDDPAAIKARLDGFAIRMANGQWPFLCSICHEYDGEAKTKTGENIPFKLLKVG